jgi:hypothetical protein
METNQEGKAEKFFKEFGKKMDQFLVEVKDAGNGWKRIFRQNLTSLKPLPTNSKTKLKTRSAGKRWKAV